jgi:aspartate ammonia-lyase
MAHSNGQSILELVRQEHLLSEEVLQQALSVEQMLQPPLELAI